MSQAPPPPLPQSIVLGLNTWNCKTRISNANWETQLNEQVNINNGDSINVKASYIDTRGTASANIDILADTTISLDYYFYWIHTFNACNGANLNAVPSPVDGSNNLTQQVLVGQTIPQLYTQNAIVNPTTPVPAYYVDNATYDKATAVNDADGLPYIVYQSTENFPVAPIYGAVVGASTIAPPQVYVVHSVGVTTNWEYAGVVGAIKNRIPGFLVDQNTFTSAANPNVNVPVTDWLLPIEVYPTLPYVSYQITSLGTTDWAIIDPSSVGISIDFALGIVTGGSTYTIDQTNASVDFTTVGAATNNPGQEFIYTPTATASAPPYFPMGLNNAFWTAQGSTWYGAGLLAFDGTQYTFGQDTNDILNCVCDLDPTTGDFIISDCVGSGSWCSFLNPFGEDFQYFNVPLDAMGFSESTPNVVNLSLSLTSIGTPTIIPADQAQINRSYWTNALGDADAVPSGFTWNMISADFVVNSTSASWVTNGYYQIVALNGSDFTASGSPTNTIGQFFRYNGTPPAAGTGSVIRFWEIDNGGTLALAPLWFVCTVPNFQGNVGSATILTQNDLLQPTPMTPAGNGYIKPITVFSGGVQVGSIIRSLHPGTGTGTGTIVPTPNPNDGTVRTYVPATTRTDIRPVKKRWSMTLPKGSYDPNYLAQLISRNMSRQKVKRVNQVTGGPFGVQSTLTVPTDSIYNNASAISGDIWTSPVGSLKQNTFFDSKNPAVYGYPSTLDYNLPPDNEDDMPFLFTPAMNSTALTNAGTVNNNYIWAEIPHPNSAGLNNLPNPTYNINLVPLVSDVRSISRTIPDSVVADGYYSILPFYSNQSGVNNGIFPVCFGATQTSLLYSNENNGLFSFNYLHSPILVYLASNQNNLTECTGHMYVANTKTTNMGPTTYYTTQIDKKSGVLLNAMEPKSFWRQLGFEPDAIVVDLDNQVGFQMTLKEFNDRTTGGFSGSSNIFNPLIKTTNSVDQPNVPDTELIYLTAITSELPPDPGIPFEPLTGTLTIGNTYRITQLGTQYTNADPPPVTPTQPFTQWDFPANSLGEYPTNGGVCNLPGPAQVGTIFVATTTGFGPVESQDEPRSFFWGPGTYFTGVSIVVGTQVQAITAASVTTPVSSTYFQVSNTNTLNANSIPLQRDSAGHYLIEITGYNSIYLDDNSKYEIKSVVSSYYVSANSFVSQPFPDSYTFYNYGAPVTLSNIKVRILDPYTMEEAVIGPNSSVYLQVNKMLTAQAVAQVEN